MADEKPDDEPVEVPAEDATPPEKPAETPPPPPAEEPKPGGDVDVAEMTAQLPEVLQVLQSVGLHMSKDTTVGNCFHGIIAAGKTKAANEATANADVGDEDLEDEDEIPDENQPGSQPANPPSPILMSQAQVALQDENTNLRSRLAKERRVQIGRDIKRLAKHIGPKVISRLEAELRTTHDDQLVAPVSLSSATAGNAIPVLKQIEVLQEAAAAGQFGKGISLSSARRAETVAAPEGPGGNEPSRGDEKTAKENGRRLGDMYLGRKAATK